MPTIPHVNVVLKGLSEQIKQPNDTVNMPRQMLLDLLDLYICCWDFDEAWYMTTYPDVRQAVEDGKFPSGWKHFRQVGYFEGRLGAQPFVDSDWYVSTYPDIAKAMLDGKVNSAAEHFVQHGYKEGRLPCDPQIVPRWYLPRYMPGADAAKVGSDDMLRHFLNGGMLQMSLPSPPR
jgi:hypothetical protein